MNVGPFSASHHTKIRIGKGLKQDRRVWQAVASFPWRANWISL